MCWRGRSNKKVADKDIKVYKVLLKYEDKYIPYFYSDKLAYEVGKCYKQEMDVNKNSYLYTIRAGFHSYSIENTKIKRAQVGNLIKYEIGSVVYGDYFDEYYDVESDILHTTNNDLGDISVKDVVHFVKCIIPKGAEYFENEEGLIVSNEIIVTGEEMDLNFLDNFVV